MKKTIWLLLLLLLLGFAAYYIMTKHEKQVSYDLSDSEFKLTNKDEIAKVFLAYKNKPSVTLVKDNNDWIYNGKYKVNPNVINNLMDVFTRCRVSYIPPKAAVKNIYKEIGLFGIKVELFNTKDELLKSYYIGGNNMSESATFFLMEGEKQPYAMTIPGHDGNLTARFKLEGSDWRDKTIFGDKQQDISTISVVYPKQKTISFKIINDNNTYKVEPFYKTTTHITSKLSPSNVDNYFTDIEEKMAESFIDHHPKRDSLEQLVPFCEISILKKDGSSKKVKLVPMTHVNTKGFGSIESQRFFALFDNGDMMLTQNRVIKTLFRPYDYFFMPRE